jgi:hypothetical protein
VLRIKKNLEKREKSSLMFVLVLILMLAVSAGGCGGGGSDDEADPYSPPPLPPIPQYPDTPETPKPIIPETPVNFKALEGVWVFDESKESGGTIAAAEYGASGLTLLGGSAEIENVEVSGNQILLDLKRSFDWRVDAVNDTYSRAEKNFKRGVRGIVGGNKISLLPASEDAGGVAVSSLNITLIDSDELSVAESGAVERYGVYSANYYLKKTGGVAGNWIDVADTSWYDVGSEWGVSSDDNFTLSTAAQLAGLAKLVGEGTDFSGKTVTLAADIDLAGREWTPIAGSGDYSLDVFDGNGHTISGMTIDRPDESEVGFFKANERTTIKKVVLTGVNVRGKARAGGVAGRNYTGGAVENCAVYGNVSVSGGFDTPDDTNAGGLVGENYGKITECGADVRVEGIGGGAGGLVGKNSGEVTSSIASGDVSGTRDAGGLVGYNLNGAVGYSRASGRVTGDENHGGVIGRHVQDVTQANYIESNTFSKSGTGQIYGIGFDSRLAGNPSDIGCLPDPVD